MVRARCTPTAGLLLALVLHLPLAGAMYLSGHAALAAAPASPESCLLAVSFADVGCGQVFEEARLRIAGDVALHHGAPRANNYKMVSIANLPAESYKVVARHGHNFTARGAPGADATRLELHFTGRPGSCSLAARADTVKPEGYCALRGLYCGERDGCSPKLADFAGRYAEVRVDCGPWDASLC
mmetsp:Transcript_29970/g.85897  ORF Transcript_29970/g.85897 Transcript_29970/m.85897 type:complete len:184 (-) Transcript_29970:95-646(-)